MHRPEVFGICCAIAIVFALPSAAVTCRPIDDAHVMMVLRPEMAGAGGLISDNVSNGCAYDLFDWGGTASSKVTLTQPQTAGIPLAYLTNDVFATPVHAMTPAGHPVIYFPQPSYSNETDNAWYAARNRVLLNNAASDSLEQTFYCRFRWDGQSVPLYANHMQIFMAGYDWNFTTSKTIGGQTINSSGCGVTMYIDPKNASTGYLKVQVFNDQGISSIEIPTNKWIDAFCTVRPGTEENTNAVFTLHAIVTPDTALTPEKQLYWIKPSMTTKTRTVGKIVYYDLSRRPNVYLGAESNAAYAKVTKNTDSSVSTFRGAIAAYASWDRILTQDEMWQVASGFHGSTWTVGAINGKAEEFARAAETTADTFEVTNAWRNCRRALTTDHPSLTLKGPLPKEWADLGHLLHIVPLFGSDAPTPCPVQITVCGTVLPGTYDLRTVDGRNIFIKDKYWTRDANGDVSVTLTRIGDPIAGTVTFDAIALVGSWCLGKVDGTNDGPAESQVVSDYWIGDMEYSKHRQRGICLASAFNHENVHMYLPPEIASRDYRYQLDTKVLSMISGLSGKMAVGFYVNDHLVDIKRDLKTSDAVSVDVPKEFLVPGLNTVVFSNASNGADGQNNNWCNIDYYRLTLRDIRRGMMLLIK